MPEEHNHLDKKSVVVMRTMEIVVALLFILFGLVVMVGSIKLGANWGSDGPEAGYFPFYISIIIVASCLVTLYRAITQKSHQSDQSFVDRLALKQVMSVLLPAIIFVLGVQLIGIYISSLIYISIFMIWLGKYPAWKAILVAICVSVALYMMFEYWFQVPLPHGTWLNITDLIGL